MPEGRLPDLPCIGVNRRLTGRIGSWSSGLCIREGEGKDMNALRLFTLTVLLVVAVQVGADEIAVTVYNSNLGVISETRTLELEQGVNRFAFKDVPALIDASSVRFEIVDESRQVTILEQNYAYDLVNPAQLYTKHIDERIELIDEQGRLYEGVLLAHGGNSVTLGNESGQVKIISLENITEVNFPALPEGLITRPTLFWLYRSDFTGALTSQVGYQTAGLTWTAEYVGVLDESEAMQHEDRHIVSNVVGCPGMRIEIGSPIKLAPRDTVLLGSDGLFDNLRVDEIVHRVRKGPLDKAIAELAKLSRTRMVEPTDQHAMSKPDDLTIVGFRPVQRLRRRDTEPGQ